MIKRFSIILELNTETNEKKIISQKEIVETNKDKFEEFWKLYPRKIGKKDCSKRFSKLWDEVADKILLALPNYIIFWKEREKEWREKFKPSVKQPYPFIPHPSTWLNQERWEDELDIPKKESINKDTKFVF